MSPRRRAIELASRRHVSRPRARLIRVGHVVETGGGAVVRFDSECTMPGCGGCRAAVSRGAEISLAWLQEVREVSVGDAVAVEFTARALTRAAAMVFGLPLAALLVGAWLGGLAAGSVGLPADDVGAVLGLAGLVLACLTVTRCGDKVTRTLRLTVHRARIER